jgi:hypothetical protein
LKALNNLPEILRKMLVRTLPSFGTMLAGAATRKSLARISPPLAQQHKKLSMPYQTHLNINRGLMRVKCLLIQGHQHEGKASSGENWAMAPSTLQIPSGNVRKFFYSILLFRVNDPIKWFFPSFPVSLLFLLLLTVSKCAS